MERCKGARVRLLISHDVRVLHWVSVRIPEGAPAGSTGIQTRPIFAKSQAKSRDDEVRRDANKEELVSVSNAKGPPVPIPNTEVKLCSAENTCLETDRKDRSTLTHIKNAYAF